MGGDLSPPIGGGLMGGDKVSMGGDSRVIFATILHAVLTTKSHFCLGIRRGQVYQRMPAFVIKSKESNFLIKGLRTEIIPKKACTLTWD